MQRLGVLLCFFAANFFFAPSPVLAIGNESGAISGNVHDHTGAIITRAQIELLDSGMSRLYRAETDDDGRFAFENLKARDYIVRIGKTGFKEATRTVSILSNEKISVDVGLEIEGLSDSVTVTPARGEVQQVFDTPESVSIATGEELSRRAFLILPQALKEETGIHLQQTTTSQGSIFIRGLSGQQVVSLIDGVRFNNSTMRPGANQYTAFIDPAFAGRVEIVRGSNSSQYGSDSLGGTVNIMTRPVSEITGGFKLNGDFNTFFGGADLSTGGGLRLSGGERDWGFAAGVTARRMGDLRTGGGIDSHSVVTRLFGLSSKILGDRLQDSGYKQYGANAKFVYNPSKNDSLTFGYLHGTQRGVSRYDQLNGGAGNLLNTFEPQVLNFFTARYDRIGFGFLDSLSTTFSFNGQRDDRRYQNINNSAFGLRSKITDEYNRTNAFGYQIQAATHIGGRSSVVFGGEFYDEFIASRRNEASFSTATGDYTNIANVRARFPNGARYRTLGLFAQNIVNIIPQKLTGSFGIRYSRFSYSQSPDANPLYANGTPTVSEFRTSLDDVTFNTGLVYSVNEHLNLTGNFSRGFRAPNVNDLASIGISGIGFEITADEGVRLAGFTADFDPNHPENTITKLIHKLRPERNYSYEFGAKFRSSRTTGTIVAFNSDLIDLIERRTILLPPGATGRLVGGQPIVRQDATGAVFTSLSNSPVFVRTNAHHIRMRGVEASVSLKLTRELSFTTNASYVRGTDLETDLPPALENGIPPMTGFVSLKWEPAGKRFWLESYSNFAAPQNRLSDNDFKQARIGGIRTRGDIINFFNNGAVARGLVRNGILLATGETVEQVYLRVLGPDPNAKTPLYMKNPGFATFNLRGGYRLGENSTVTLLLENILDKNYRTMGSGIDAAGINAVVRWSVKF